MPRFDDSDAGEFSLPPEGRYLAEVIEFEDRKSKRDGHPMVNLKLKIVEGEFNGSWFFDTVMFGGGGANIGKAKTKALTGVELEKGMNFDSAQFIGQRAYAHVAHEEYKGKTNLRVDINAGSHCGYEPLRAEATDGDGPSMDLSDIPF